MTGLTSLAVARVSAGDTAWMLAATALVGSHEQVAQRITEYAELGFDEFVLSGYPHLEEAWRVGEEVLPLLR